MQYNVIIKATLLTKNAIKSTYEFNNQSFANLLCINVKIPRHFPNLSQIFHQPTEQNTN